MQNTSHGTSSIEAARGLIRRGFYVVPIPRGTKHPILTNWPELRLTEFDLQQYFLGDCGIGLLLRPSKLADIDCDCAEAVAAAKVLLPMTEMIHGHRSNPASHHYYRVESPSPNQAFVDPQRPRGDGAMLVELRTNGQTVVPPSHHTPTGEVIEWTKDGEAAVIDFPALSAKCAEVAAAALLARYWAVGSRHHAALALAGMLLRAGWPEPRVRAFVLAVATAAGDNERASRLHDVLTTAARLGENRTTTGAPTLAEIVGDAVVQKVREWLHLDGAAFDTYVAHLSDLGNARRLVNLHGIDLRYCYPRGKWLVWSGSRWEWDESGEIERRAKNTIKSLYEEAAAQDNLEGRQKILKHALHSESEQRLRAMITVSKSEVGIPVAPRELDADIWLFNCANGTIDLRTGKLLPHARQNLCSKLAPVEFDQDATCPTWEAFLHRVLNEDAALIEFVQRAIGYTLTGSVKEQVLFFLYGTGANGKSTFVELIRKMLGDYGLQADFATFLHRKDDGPRNDLARLVGSRFVAAVEAGAGRQLDENVIKQVTGGDTITARYLYHEHFEFPPQFKLVLAANYKPKITGTDEAIWRRIRLVPFNVMIPKPERDPELIEKLERELPGILAWAVRGCLSFQESGLGEPAAVSSATDAYRAEMDQVGRFVNDCCVAKPGARLAASAIYSGYQAWCQTNGEEPMARNLFGAQLDAHGFEADRKNGKRVRKGIEFLE